MTRCWRIEYRADVEGDWTDVCHDDTLRFASRSDAEQWWATHYRGADEYGNQAHPTFVEEEEEEDWELGHTARRCAGRQHDSLRGDETGRRNAQDEA